MPTKMINRNLICPHCSIPLDGKNFIMNYHIYQCGTCGHVIANLWENRVAKRYRYEEHGFTVIIHGFD